MAEKYIYKAQLRLILEDGYDEEKGQQIFKTKSFNNVDPSSAAEALYAVGQAFAKLQTLPLDTIECNEQSTITG